MDSAFPREFVWHPTPDYTERSHLRRFMLLHGLKTYAELQEWSVRDVARFTHAVIQYLDIRFQSPYSQIIDLSPGIQFPRWCVGGKLNIVHNCVDKWTDDPQTRDRKAILWEGEEGPTRALTYGELALQVNQCTNALLSLGLKKGDKIGLFMPMTPEICVALFAIAKIGGVILPLFSGFGAEAISTRLRDAGAKAVFTADGVFRRGRLVPLKPTLDLAVQQVPTVRHVIVARRASNTIVMSSVRDHWWHELVSSQPVSAVLEPTEAEDLLMIIYTSGTTGKPKGAVHTHCSFPIKAAQDMAFGTDVQGGEPIYWVTDMGWMMGPWLLFGTTLLGGMCLLYDGALDYPGPDRLWSLAEKHRLEILGLSPTLVRSLIPYGEAPVRAHDLSALRIMASTGEPWDLQSWKWLFEVVGERRRPIINYSGGTEIAGGILMGNPMLPLKPTAFSAPCPGMAADVVDGEGKSVQQAVGELVIRAPWIGMTRGFWKDQDQERYVEAYWSRFKDTWVHGDWVARDEDGMWYILGRSDDTMKVAGKRIGPAEVESILTGHPAVTEAAAVAIPHEIKGNEVVCFCVLAPGRKSDDALNCQLKSMVVEALGKPLQPREIRFVSDLPKTRNAKIIRRMVRSAYLGLDPGDTSGLVNPEVLEEIRRCR